MRLARAWILLLLIVPLRPALAGPTDADPRALGFDPDRLARIDDAVNRSIANGDVPGVVVVVGRAGGIGYARAFGRRAIDPEAEPMTRDTAFDMASLTKPVATATSALLLIERGRLRLDDRLGRLLPAFDNHGKGAITVEQLMRHRSGLIADNPIGDYADGPDRAWERLANLGMVAPPGERFLYSDVNFIILGRIVETLSGEPLDRFAAANVFGPIGMSDSAFRPLNQDRSRGVPVERIAPTEREDGAMLRGVVHDPRSRALGGVAGHAGLFGTADDLATFARTLLAGGLAPNGARLLAPLTVRAAADPGDTPAGQRRGLGWDVATGFSAPRGALFGPASFGHTGFTGTSLWIDPEADCFVVLLTSRLHPDGKKPSPTALRSEVATIAASALLDAPTTPTRRETAPPAARREPVQRVECGIDVLVEEGFARLRGKRIGLVTNHTGRTRDGRSTIDVLFEAKEVKLAALFSPEHGIRGQVDKAVPDGKDEKTGLPIYSLYGKTRRPTAESLEGLDGLVYDIQDIGARFYTYISTLGLVLEAAKERDIPVWVLDRPNPIGGVAVDGPVRDADFASFIAYHALPVRHGMTVGELALMFNGERSIGADLDVVRCRGWRRDLLFDRTGLLWVNPSPNMRSLTEALIYPGVGLLEASNLATGRGTDTPFERVGAPYIDPVDWARALDRLNLPGVRFVPVRFQPSERQYAGTDCGGVTIIVDDWSRFEPIGLGMGLAVTLRKLYPQHWKPEGFLRMLADRPTYQALLDGGDVDALRATWRAELDEFRAVRSKYLIYP